MAFFYTQVWEVKCADLSISPVHKAARGIVDPAKGGQPALPSLYQVPTNLAAHRFYGSGSGRLRVELFSLFLGVGWIIQFRKLFHVVSRFRIRMFIWHPGSVISQVRIRIFPLSSNNNKKNLESVPLAMESYVSGSFPVP